MAIDVSRPGSVIMVEGGVYTPPRRIDVHRSDITIMAVPGERPVFDAARYPTPDAFNDRVIRLRDVSNVTIVGLGFTNGPDGGMEIIGEGEAIQVVRCAAFRNGRTSRDEGQGFVVSGAISGCVFVECDSYENFDVAGGAGQNADGFQISADGTGNGCHGCRAWNNSDDGFDFFNTSFERGHTIGAVEVAGCQAWRNGYLADGRPSGGDGTGFKLGGQRPGLGNGSGGNTVRGCLSWANSAIGFTDNRCTIPNRLFDNIAHDNGRINYETHVATELRRNVGYRAGEKDVSIADWSNVGRNSWNAGRSGGSTG